MEEKGQKCSQCGLFKTFDNYLLDKRIYKTKDPTRVKYHAECKKCGNLRRRLYNKEHYPTRVHGKKHIIYMVSEIDGEIGLHTKLREIQACKEIKEGHWQCCACGFNTTEKGEPYTYEEAFNCCKYPENKKAD